MKILLVDDEAGIVESLAALLQGLPGNEIKTATTGGQALQVARAWDGIDLLVTDVVMEPMDGFTLRDQVTHRYPQARTIFITGYDLSDYAEQTANHQVLAKPVERAELLGAIAREVAAIPAVESPAPAVAEPIEAAPIAPAAVEAAAPVVPEPAPVPVAVPQVAAPVARAVAAAPQAVAVPKAVPAVPKVAAVPAVATPKVAGVPVKAAAVPKAVATVPKVAAAPRAVAAPKAVAAVPKAAAPAAPAAPPPAPLPDDEMVGRTIGAYEIQAVLGDGHWGRVYRALQGSINRQVGFNLLSPEQAADESARARFLGDARAKAHVQHPSILAVYEAGETDGHYFYAHEYVDGRTLAAIQARGERLDEPTALKVLKTAAEGLDYLHAQQIPHSPVDGESLFLSLEGAPHVANVATNSATDPVAVPEEIKTIARAILGVLPPIQTVSGNFRALLSRMVQGQGLGSWSDVVQSVKAIEPKVVPLEAARLSAQDRATSAAVEAAQKAQKRSMLINVISMIVIVLLATALVWRYFSTNQRNLDEQVHIPAGAFKFGNPAVPAETGEFWIDKYEVSLGQYAKFVEYLQEHPTDEYDHPKQPKSKRAQLHKPRDWDIYYGRAKAGKPIKSVPSDLNMPVLVVDWWDAYAYAKWKGRELPTEQEWEKAARGTEGFLYPWGNELDAKKANSGADYDEDHPGAPAKVDGFNHWGPVDQQRDKSPFGVVGMAGNVAEWTATWTKDNKHPIIKGGSFTRPDVRVDQRFEKAMPDLAQENLGFRTISRTPPVP